MFLREREILPCVGTHLNDYIGRLNGRL